jgi:hypothetical protein
MTQRPTKRGRLALAFGLVVALALLAGPALAHVPATGGDNHSPETATVVSEPTKSWAFTDSLRDGGAAYYRLSLLDGERLTASVYTPRRDLAPGLVIMSPELEERGDVPPGVTVPDGYGAEVVEPVRPDRAELEPFTPGAYYYTVDVERPVSGGTYLLAVYDDGNRSGPVGVAIGGEERFTVVEYLTVPLDLVDVHRWEGDSLLVIAGPVALALLVGGVLLRRRLAGRDSPVTRWALAGAALLLLGTAASVLVQLGIALAMAGPSAAALLPVAFVAVPAVIAWWLLRVATGDDLALGARRRAGLVLAGLAGLATWAGFLVAPAAALLVAAVPADRLP